MKRFAETIARLEAKIERLEAELAIERAENKALRIKVASLEEKLGLNSKNSSIPSSKELYKIKSANKQKSNRSIGGQPGHKGSFRGRDKADEVVFVDISRDCECGGEVRVSKEPYIHQKVDLPEIKPYVVEYQLAHGRCKKCGKRSSAGLPRGVTRDRFGPRIKSVIGSLTGFYKNSKQEVANILKDLFNLDISLGSISNSEARVSDRCKDNYDTIEQSLSWSDLLHIDETSHYNKGKLGWCWLFSNRDASLIKLEETRGMKVLENSGFSADDNAVIVTDRYAAYNYFAPENRQVCWAHLARDFERFSHSFHHDVQVMGVYLRQVSGELFGLKKALESGEIGVLVFLRRARKLRKRTYYYLKAISHVNDATQAVRMANNIIKSESMMWKFLDNPTFIPLTNNHAERQIRHYVVYRKNSYFTQSKRGNKFLERIISLYLTSKQNLQNPFQNLLTLMV